MTAFTESLVKHPGPPPHARHRLAVSHDAAPAAEAWRPGDHFLFILCSFSLTTWREHSKQTMTCKLHTPTICSHFSSSGGGCHCGMTHTLLGDEAALVCASHFQDVFLDASQS